MLFLAKHMLWSLEITGIRQILAGVENNSKSSRLNQWVCANIKFPITGAHIISK